MTNQEKTFKGKVFLPAALKKEKANPREHNFNPSETLRLLSPFLLAQSYTFSKQGNSHLFKYSNQLSRCCNAELTYVAL